MKITNKQYRKRTNMQLKIIITTQSYHPHFDLPPNTVVKLFNMENGNDAELYYLEQKEQADKSRGLMSVGISIVHKLNKIGERVDV